MNIYALFAAPSLQNRRYSSVARIHSMTIEAPITKVFQFHPGFLLVSSKINLMANVCSTQDHRGTAMHPRKHLLNDLRNESFVWSSSSGALKDTNAPCGLNPPSGSTCRNSIFLWELQGRVSSQVLLSCCNKGTSLQTSIECIFQQHLLVFGCFEGINYLNISHNPTSEINVVITYNKCTQWLLCTISLITAGLWTSRSKTSCRLSSSRVTDFVTMCLYSTYSRSSDALVFQRNNFL